MKNANSRRLSLAVGTALLGSALFVASPSLAASVGVPPDQQTTDQRNGQQGMNGGPNMTEGAADSSGSVPLAGEEPWRARTARPQASMANGAAPGYLRAHYRHHLRHHHRVRRQSPEGK